MSTYKQRQMKEARKIAETIDDQDEDLFKSVVNWSFPVRFLMQCGVISLTAVILFIIGDAL